MLPHLIRVLMSLEPLIPAFVIYSVGQIQQYQLLKEIVFLVVWLQNGLVARGHWCIFSVTLRSLFEGVLSYCCVVIFFSQGDFCYNS